MYSKIVIVGLNGSGKTTLGRQLAEAFGYKHMDIEDYYFKESDIPYANPRTREEVMELLLADMKKHENFVFSTVNGDFGDEINALYDLAICLKAPLDVRLERVKQRSIDKFGDRVREGGDMYEQEQRFFTFVASRTTEKTDMFLQKLNCPVIDIDAAQSIESSLKLIKEKITCF